MRAPTIEPSKRNKTPPMSISTNKSRKLKNRGSHTYYILLRHIKKDFKTSSRLSCKIIGVLHGQIKFLSIRSYVRLFWNDFLLAKCGLEYNTLGARVAFLVCVFLQVSQYSIVRTKIYIIIPKYCTFQYNISMVRLVSAKFTLREG